jgi:hypothetical protein
VPYAGLTRARPDLAAKEVAVRVSRIYFCARCKIRVRLCTTCDRGQIYCAGECRRARRRLTLLESGRRYQEGRQGRRKHAARQHRYRARQAAKVTHQGSLPPAPEANIPASTEAHVATAAPTSTPEQRVANADLCSFCERLCGPFVRVLPACWHRHRPRPGQRIKARSMSE